MRLQTLGNWDVAVALIYLCMYSSIHSTHMSMNISWTVGTMILVTNLVQAVTIRQRLKELVS